MPKELTTRQKKRRTMLGKKPNRGKPGNRPVKITKAGRKQRVHDVGRRRGGR